MGPDVDAAVARLGPENLRELAALAWFCDCMPDGKYALIPSDRRGHYSGAGPRAALTETGCVRLLNKAFCAGIGSHRPALKMEQFGRRVLRRAAAMGIDLDPAPSDEMED